MGAFDPLPDPGKPILGTIMDEKVLSSRAMALDPKAFTGQVDPTLVWNEMLNDSFRAFGYYRDLEEKDDQIAQCLETRKAAVLGRDRQLLSASKSADDMKRMEFGKEVLRAIPDFDETLNELLDAPPYGVAFAEIIWGMDGKRVYVQAIKPRAPEWFLFNPIIQLQTGPLRLKSTVWDIEGVPVPEHKFLVWTYRPRHGNRRGRPLLRRVFWPSWFKRQDMRFWLKWAEKGSGTVAVRYQAGASTAEQAKALEAAEAVHQSVAVAFPQGFEIVPELLKTARTGDTASYHTLLEQCEGAIAKVILGQTLTSGQASSGRGSLALAQIHQAVRAEKVWEDAAGLEHTINDQLLYWLYYFNEGPDVVRPKWTIDVEEPEDLQARSQTDKTLQGMGLPITERYLRETYGVPEPEEDDEILVPMKTPGAFGGGAPTSGDPGAKQFTERDARDADHDLSTLETGARTTGMNAYESLIERLSKEALLEIGGDSAAGAPAPNVRTKKRKKAL
jgi:phage gp29-like protein